MISFIIRDLPQLYVSIALTPERDEKIYDEVKDVINKLVIKGDIIIPKGPSGCGESQKRTVFVIYVGQVSC